MSSIPESNASSTINWIVGLSTIGSISFAMAFVAGKNVPSPAAGMTAFDLHLLFLLVKYHLSNSFIQNVSRL